MQSNEKNKSRNIVLIVGGSCCGCVVLVVPILAAIMLPVFSQARAAAQRASCMSNVKIQALGTLMYVQDYDEKLPKTAGWMDTITPYIKNERDFHCPTVAKDDPAACGYAMNSFLSGARLAEIEIPMQTALTYDSTNLGRSVTDKCVSIPVNPKVRHTSDNISFMDGHASTFKQDVIDAEIQAISADPVTHTPKSKR